MREIRLVAKRDRWLVAKRDPEKGGRVRDRRERMIDEGKITGRPFAVPTFFPTPAMVQPVRC